MDMVEREIKIIQKLNEETLRTIVLESERRKMQERELSSVVIDSLRRF